jgi:flagellar motor switch protein FliM
MAEQILSQDEIDALLGAMAKGDVEVDPGDKGREPKATPYDLTSKGVMIQDEFAVLEEVYDRFIRLSRRKLSAELRRPIDVAFVSTEGVSFHDFIQGFSFPTSFNFFSMAPLSGQALLAIDASLVFSLIDCMFGGDGKPYTQKRDFTPIEQRMTRRFVQQVLECYQESWQIVDTLRMTLKKTETKPEFIHLYSPSDLVIVVVFEIAGEQFKGNIHLCISYLMMDPIKDKLSTNYLREKNRENAWGRHFENLLRQVPVELVAELGETRYSVRELLDLKCGDVLKIEAGPEDLITVKVADVPKYRGFPGIVKGNRAIEVANAITHRRGAKRHGRKQ